MAAAEPPPPAERPGRVPRLVTVDGPAGSGKSTLGRRLALWLDVPLIDTGLLYRAVTVAAGRRGVRGDDAAALAQLAGSAAVEVDTDPRIDAPTVRAFGVEVTAELYDPSRAALLAAVSRNPGVRRALLPVQRRLARGGEAVAVGRDCGTVVFSEAPVKLYLEAEETVRLERRARQLVHRYGGVDPATLAGEVEGRDRSDAARAVSPMRPAADALVIRTDSVDVDGMVELAIAACREAGVSP